LSAHGDSLEEVSIGESISAKRSRKYSTLDDDWDGLAQEIAHFPALDVPTLGKGWTAVMSNAPSLNWRRALLMRAIAYRLQERWSAGLKPSTRRFFERVAKNRSRDPSQSISRNGGQVWGQC
jgi:hypothetical protein